MTYDIQLRTETDFDGNEDTFKEVKVILPSGREIVFTYEETKTDQEIEDDIVAKLAADEADE